MRAKEVVERMSQAVQGKTGAPGHELTQDEIDDIQANEFVGCAWEEFKRVLEVRFKANKGRIAVESVRSLANDFNMWGIAVARTAKLPWMRETCGRVLFSAFLDFLFKEAGENIGSGAILISDKGVPDFADGVSRIRTGL